MLPKIILEMCHSQAFAFLFTSVITNLNKNCQSTFLIVSKFLKIIWSVSPESVHSSLDNNFYSNKTKAYSVKIMWKCVKWLTWPQRTRCVQNVTLIVCFESLILSLCWPPQVSYLSCLSNLQQLSIMNNPCVIMSTSSSNLYPFKLWLHKCHKLHRGC